MWHVAWRSEVGIAGVQKIQRPSDNESLVSRRSKDQVIMFYKLIIIMTTGKQWPLLVKVDMMMMTNRSIGLPRWTWQWLELRGEHDEDHNMMRASRWKWWLLESFKVDTVTIRELQGGHNDYLRASRWTQWLLESFRVDIVTIRELQGGHNDY